jgi:hypothetical protein
MKDLSAFLTRVIPYATGCSEPMAIQALLDSAIEFCERSLVVQARLEPTPMVMAQAKYDLGLPLQQDCAMVMRAWLDNHLLTPQATEHAYANGSAPGTPRFYSTDNSDGALALVVEPPPDAGSVGLNLVAKVALRPTRAATKVDDTLYANWAEGIAAGALRRILSIPGQPFSDDARAGMFYVIFKQHLQTARIEGYRGRSVSAISVLSRPFA